MEKSSTELNTDDEMNQSPECLAESLKKVVIDETKNTVQEAPPLKPDTPKIALKQFDFKFLVTDTFTDSTVGLYPTNKVATHVIIELVKKDILLYVDMYQKKILIGESIEENRDSLAIIKNLMYQYKTIEQSMNTSILVENKAVNRYRVMCLKVDEREVDESDFFNF